MWKGWPATVGSESVLNCQSAHARSASIVDNQCWRQTDGAVEPVGEISALQSVRNALIAVTVHSSLRAHHYELLEL